MKVELVESGDMAVVHLDLRNRNGSIDKCAWRKISADHDKGWRNVALWALSYKGVKRAGDIKIEYDPGDPYFAQVSCQRVGDIRGKTERAKERERFNYLNATHEERQAMYEDVFKAA